MSTPVPESTHLSQYLERGFLKLPQVLSSQAVTQLLQALNELTLPKVIKSNPYGIIQHNLSEQSPAFRSFLEDGWLAECVRPFLGHSSVTLFQDHLIWKPPGILQSVQWHQDYAYWPLKPAKGLTLWLALDDADDSNGCLRYAPGSHKQGPKRPADFFEEGAERPPSPLSELPAIDATGVSSEACPVEAGGMIIHHPYAWHMSHGNRSRRDRRAWSLTWVTPEVRWSPERTAHPYNYQFQPRPGSRLDGDRFLSFP